MAIDQMSITDWPMTLALFDWSMTLFVRFPTCNTIQLASDTILTLPDTSGGLLVTTAPSITIVN